MIGKTGAPEEIRTPDPQIRSLVLYPAELRARAAVKRRVPRRSGPERGIAIRCNPRLARVAAGLIEGRQGPIQARYSTPARRDCDAGAVGERAIAASG